jgi:hypothetical protein
MTQLKKNWKTEFSPLYIGGRKVLVYINPRCTNLDCQHFRTFITENVYYLKRFTAEM